MRTGGDAYESTEYRDGVIAQMALERGEPERILREDRTGPWFIVAGARGAIECRVLPGGAPVSVDYHSPCPTSPGDESFPCDVLQVPCHPEAGGDVPALRAAWYAGGCDDGVIWRELEDRYRAWKAEG